jgi:hypothetical protein
MAVMDSRVVFMDVGGADQRDMALLGHTLRRGEQQRHAEPDQPDHCRAAVGPAVIGQRVAAQLCLQSFDVQDHPQLAGIGGVIVAQ